MIMKIRHIWLHVDQFPVELNKSADAFTLTFVLLSKITAVSLLTDINQLLNSLSKDAFVQMKGMELMN